MGCTQNLCSCALQCEGDTHNVLDVHLREGRYAQSLYFVSATTWDVHTVSLVVFCHVWGIHTMFGMFIYEWGDTHKICILF